MTLVPGADLRPSEEMVELEKSDKGTSRPLGCGLNVQFVALGNPDLPLDNSPLRKRNCFFFSRLFANRRFNEAYCFGSFGLAVLGSVFSNRSCAEAGRPDKVAPEFRDAAVQKSGVRRRSK
jgi:hypothetical protein